MSKPDDEWTIRRILVALDASHHSLAALEAAVELAESMDAELRGLFVEDVELLRAAGAPAARELRYPFVTGARMNPQGMERALRAQAAQARRALVTVCERQQVPCSFRVVRGEVAPQVLAAALEADLLIMGKVSRPLIRRIRMGSTARAAAAEAPCCVLLLRRGGAIGPPVVLAYDGSPAAQQALTVAAHLARRQRGYLSVLILTAAAEKARELESQVVDRLHGQELVIRFSRLEDTSVSTLIQLLAAEKSGVLVLGGTSLAPEALQTLLDEVDCPVLLVR